MTYTIEDHKHRLAAWEASTAAKASPLCRFPVSIGVEILESCGFTPQLAQPTQLPKPEKLDEVHRRWREKGIDEARMKGYTFTHGIIAKLINSYLKTRFVCSNYHEDDRVKYLHPPIDRLLLKELADQNIASLRDDWRRFENIGWSKFTSNEYEEVIGLIRKAMPGRPLWEIEQYWKGYQ